MSSSNENTKLISKKCSQSPSNFDRRLSLNEDFGDLINRNEFSRDRDRIIFSKAFRRLEHKAQIYSHIKGDHYRTRLTHTIEVMQIARSLSRNLGLNEDLTEAIALGHDIGHTPFGHQGEKVLDNIMCGKDDLGGVIQFKLNYGGFKHNFNGIRTIDILEKKYKNETGLNLTWQVIDGILKHTKIEKPGKKWDLDRFIQNQSYIKDFIKYNYPVTLEGQIVAIADEIAQRQHDLDDGLRDSDLKLNETQIIKYIQSTITDIIHETEKQLASIDIMDLDDENRKKFNDYIHSVKPSDVLDDIYVINNKTPIDYDLWEKILINRFISDVIVSDYKEVQLLKKLKSNIEKREDDSFDRNSIDMNMNENKYFLWDTLIRDIIDYFIKDVTLNSYSKLSNLVNDKLIDEDNNKISVKYNSLDVTNGLWKDSEKLNYHIRKYFDVKLIDFSECGFKFDKQLEKYINYQILNSFNVNRFDGKAIFIVRQLFKAYYTNPKQMPTDTLNKLFYRLNKNYKNFGKKIILDEEGFNEVRFRTSRPEDIDKLIKLLKLELNRQDLEKIFKLTYSINDNTDLI